ncbi:type II secretion system F family protein [Lignipirellula cremea]|nr:type II secretion system F family protein [Lignipirellula cremea]
MAGLAAAAAAGLCLGWLVAGFFRPHRDPEDLDGLEVKRRASLRENSRVYRYCETEIQDLLPLNGTGDPRDYESLAIDLSLAYPHEPWTPREYFAAQQTLALLVGLVLFFLLVLAAPLVSGLLVLLAAPVGLIVGLLFYLLQMLAIGSGSRRYRERFGSRLPYGIDLLTLTMEAGANLIDALKIVARENAGHPLGLELSRVVQQMALGRPLDEALESLAERVQDDDTSELVFAINKGHELGSSISTTLRTQSEQINLRRSQSAERAAKEAEVKMTAPNMLIMIACVIVIMGPILLPLLYQVGVGFEF